MKKEPVRPNLGGILRPRQEKGRGKFLYIEVTPDEKKKIHNHCVLKGLSFSHFLSDTMIAEATKPKPSANVVLKTDFGLSREEYEKLELLAFLQDKRSINELIREMIQEGLNLQKLHSKRKRAFVRYYLSREEHAKISSHIAALGVPAGKYAAMLALKTVSAQGNQASTEENGQ
jgi:hypothetical protein